MILATAPTRSHHDDGCAPAAACVATIVKGTPPVDISCRCKLSITYGLMNGHATGCVRSLAQMWSGPSSGVTSVGCLHGVTESGHVQVAAARPIVGGDVSDPGADGHERAPAVGEAADDPGAPADLPVEASESCCSCGSAAGAPGDTRRADRSWSRRYLPSGRRPPDKGLRTFSWR